MSPPKFQTGQRVYNPEWSNLTLARAYCVIEDVRDGFYWLNWAGRTYCVGESYLRGWKVYTDSTKAELI